ncbi:MAG: beta-ketoacyl synthase N-terminal-like domain-containing protein, partial [Verrucomicrobiota bacterium]
MKRNRVFVTGLGVVSSIGNNYEELVDSLRNLRHGFEPYSVLVDHPLVDVVLAGRPKGYEVDSADFEDWEFPEGLRIKREILRGMPPHGPFTYFAMLQAIADAQLSEEDVSNVDTGIYTASGGSQRLAFKNFIRMSKVGPMRCPPTSIVSSIAGTLSFNLVATFKIQGNSCGFSSACASSGHAIGYAFDDLTMGRQKRMFIAAGEDANLESIAPFSGMRALSLDSDPLRASCPF